MTRPEIIGWAAAGLSLSLFLFAHGIYWYDISEHKLWLDRHLEREGQPVPKRDGFWWRLFLKLHK